MLPKNADCYYVPIFEVKFIDFLPDWCGYYTLHFLMYKTSDQHLCPRK